MAYAAPAEAAATAAPRLPPGRAGQRIFGIQVTTLVVLIVLWQALSVWGAGIEELFPSLHVIAGSFWEIVSRPDILPHIQASAYEVGLGFILGALPGVVFGLVAGLRDYVRRVFEPLILYLAAVPHIILFPIFILAFTIGPNSKVATAASSAIFPVVINTMAAVYSVRPVHIKVGRTLRLSHFKLVWYIYLPSMSAAILVGLRIGMGSGIVSALLAETRAANSGLGFLVSDAYNRFDISLMYALLILIFILATAVNWIMSVLAGRSRATTHRSNVSGFLV